jgi:hypothetical protein
MKTVLASIVVAIIKVFKLEGNILVEFIKFVPRPKYDAYIEYKASYRNFADTCERDKGSYDERLDQISNRMLLMMYERLEQHREDAKKESLEIEQQIKNESAGVLRKALKCL